MSIRTEMIDEAKRLHKHIYPLPHCKDIKESFTEMDDKLIFWFNIKGGSTKIIIHPKQSGKG